MNLNSTINYNYSKHHAPRLKCEGGGSKLAKKQYYDIEPDCALQWSFEESLKRLGVLIGKENLKEILNGKAVDSPSSKCNDSSWMDKAKIIGVNPRAIGSYFDIVKYAMTFPEDSIHLLPLFEQGCMNSLYAPINFKLSDEFMDKDLEKIGFDTPEKQLKLTINLLHSLNKNVGMDFLQHTDRFSQEVFINPDNFTWAKLDETSSYELEYPEINPDKLGDEVKKEVVNFLREFKDANGETVSEKTLDNFYNIPEDKRRKILFGTSTKEKEQQRRIALMDYIRNAHLETKPLSIDDPRRKITFKQMMSNENATWAVFTDNMEDKIFGNLTSYKLYHLNNDGTPDISKPNYKAWDFLCDKTADFQKEFGFDFLRADMGYLSFNDDKRDIHQKVKETINKNSNHFATFGECFAGFSNTDERSVKRKNYDAVLGNLQYQNVYDSNFNDIVKKYNFNPDYKVAIASITTDSDQACYNEHYDNFQNKIRCFMGLFLNQPSYMGMGLETRDINPIEGKNLTKDFINDWGIEKYEWGKNHDFFNLLSGMRKFYSKIKNVIKNQMHYWLWTNDNKVASWFYYSKDKTPSWLFVANTDTNSKQEVEVQNLFDTSVNEKINKTDKLALKEAYSTDKKRLEGQIMIKGKSFKVTNLLPGECRVYKVINPEEIEKFQQK